jgi:hypothetical protein
MKLMMKERVVGTGTLGGAWTIGERREAKNLKSLRVLFRFQENKLCGRQDTTTITDSNQEPLTTTTHILKFKPTTNTLSRARFKS